MNGYPQRHQRRCNRLLGGKGGAQHVQGVGDVAVRDRGGVGRGYLRDRGWLDRGGARGSTEGAAFVDVAGLAVQ